MDTVQRDEWEPNGGPSTIQIFQPNRTFVINTTPEVHDEIADLLRQLRRLQDLQVTVEVRFITVSEQFYERIGIDFDVGFNSHADNFIREEFTGQLGIPGVPPQNLTIPVANSTDPTVQLSAGGSSFLTSGNHRSGISFGRNTGGERTSDFRIPVSQSSFAAAGILTLPGISFAGLDGFRWRYRRF